MKITRNRVKKILGQDFDDEGLITLDIDDINKIINNIKTLKGG